jgi:osmotically-inducible protein OsmY
LTAIAFGVSIGTQVLAGQARTAEGAESNSVTTSSDSVSVEGHHHYQSPADRAQDALLITEVKSAIAADGISEDSPIAVDCDHGKIILSGVVKSGPDARRAGDLAARASGVVGVNNQLTWH